MGKDIMNGQYQLNQYQVRQRHDPSQREIGTASSSYSPFFFNEMHQTCLVMSIRSIFRNVYHCLPDNGLIV